MIRPHMRGLASLPRSLLRLAAILFAAALALASLVWNGLRAPTPEERRKTRVIVRGTVAVVTPFMVLQAAAVSAQRDPYGFSFWVWAPCVLAALLLPLSFAYAVVKHRVLEIPLLLKTLLFADWSSGLLKARLDRGAGAGTALGAGFGILLVWAGTRLRTRVTRRIDRAFFRSACDARLIMQALAEKTSAAATREELGTILAGHIRQALHPSSLAIYLEARDGAVPLNPPLRALPSGGGLRQRDLRRTLEKAGGHG